MANGGMPSQAAQTKQSGRPKKKGGKPTRYSKALAQNLPEMFENGETVEEVCRELKIWRSTFYEWVEKHEEFALAYDEGRARSQAWWSKLGRAGALGREKVQPALWIFNMKNRFGYRDRPAEEGGGVEDVPLTPEEFAKKSHEALRQMEAADYGDDGSAEPEESGSNNPKVVPVKATS